jgi:K+-transporting ATPase ATPase B chain
MTFIPFSAQTRMSGVDLNGRRIRKGATDQVVKFVRDAGGQAPAELPVSSSASRAAAARRWWWPTTAKSSA